VTRGTDPSQPAGLVEETNRPTPARYARMVVLDRPGPEWYERVRLAQKGPAEA